MWIFFHIKLVDIVGMLKVRDFSGFMLAQGVEAQRSRIVYNAALILMLRLSQCHKDGFTLRLT